MPGTERVSEGQQPRRTDGLMPRLTDRVRTLSSRVVPSRRVWVRQRDAGPSPAPRLADTATVVSAVISPGTVTDGVARSSSVLPVTAVHEPSKAKLHDEAAHPAVTVNRDREVVAQALDDSAPRERPTGKQFPVAAQREHPPVSTAVLKAEALGFETRDISATTAAMCRLFGVELAEYPAFVPDTPANRRVMEQLQAAGYPGGWFESGAKYESRSNFILAAGGTVDDPFTQRHESGHPIIRLLNPDLAEAEDRLHKVAENREQIPADLDVKKAITAKIIAEGGCEWGALEIDSSDPKSQKIRNFLLAGIDTDTPGNFTVTTFSQNWIDENFGILEDSIRQLEAAQNWNPDNGDPPFIDGYHVGNIPQLAIYQAFNAYYVIGNFFFYHAIEYLRSEGFHSEGLTERIQELIADPPQSIDGYRDPAAYVRTKFSLTERADAGEAGSHELPQTPIPYFEPVNTNDGDPTLRDRFGNTIVEGSYIDPDGEATPTAYLVSPEGQNLLRDNPELIATVENGIQQIHDFLQSDLVWIRAAVIDLGNGITIEEMPTVYKSTNSKVFLLTIGDEQYAVKVDNGVERKAFEDLSQPFTKETLQEQALATDREQDFAEAGVAMPAILFASDRIICEGYVDGEQPTDSAMWDKMHKLARIIRTYIRIQDSPLWNHVHLDLKPENFRQRTDGSMVFVDPFTHDILD